jgi:hypothetical protein
MYSPLSWLHDCIKLYFVMKIIIYLVICVSKKLKAEKCGLKIRIHIHILSDDTL